MDATTRDATALIATSVQAVSQEARFETYKKNEDLIKGVEVLATFDSRTTQLCMSRSGGAWSLDGKPLEFSTVKYKFPGRPPWHWRCRSTLLPVLKSFDEIETSTLKSKLKKNTSDLTKASMDGQIAANLTYEQWLRTKSKDFQIEKLGPTKWKLWNEKRITFSDMVDQSGNPLSIRQLKNKYLN